MTAARGAALAACLCLLLLPAGNGFQLEDTECAFMDQQEGTEPHSGLTNELRGAVRENGTIRCSHGSRCYGLWEKRPDGEIHLVKQGCWTHIGDQQECHGDRCLVTAPPSQIQNGSYRFCCCSRNLCNVNFTEAPPTANTPALRLMKTDRRDNGQTARQPLRREESALIALVTVAVAAVVIIALFLGYRMMRGKQQKLGLGALHLNEDGNTDAVDLDQLKLLELIGRGRYGTVFRSCLNERCLAVKLFSSANRQNYFNERSIYSLPMMQQHDNITRFLAADERTTADGRPEFLILMEFYPHGCLSRYLSLHTVDWSTCCRMTHGVTRGLAFLHTEVDRGDQYKPAVAHRDVTSRNVLVRTDLSCVLADFGLSMRLTGNQPCCPGDDDTMAISEVGTVRYMAPEVLGGALNLRDCESALKQVDVYALGLLYWESFRRCSHLFVGEAVPEYQLAFQEELGNHPTLEEMQILVLREKFRPRFPEAWKENSLMLRSLKETMEDCWDQDAEARLTAQCAEERLSELMVLTTHTALHNHRNLSHGCSPVQVGSASSYIEDQQMGVVKNLQGDSHPLSVVKTTISAADGVEKNRNSINFERQQAQSQARSTGSDSCVLAIGAQTPGSLFSSDLSTILVCQLTEEDLEATKLDPKEVHKNLRESSYENLMELSQKKFGATEPQTGNLPYRQVLPATEASSSVLTPQGDLGAAGLDAPSLSSTFHPLPKQQNLPQRPTSLHLLPKTKDPTSAASRLKLGGFKSNHKQVETGVAKMNTVMVATAVEPHLVTTVTNNTGVRSSVVNANQVQLMKATTGGYSAGAPILVKNAVLGRTNPAGPQLEEEDKVERGSVGEDSSLNLLNSSPDEHEPLLRREQPPAESTPAPHQHLHHQSGPGNIMPGQRSNANNNNNNRVVMRSDVKVQDLEVQPQRRVCSEGRPQEDPPQAGGPPESSFETILLPGPAGSAPPCNDQTLQARLKDQDEGQSSHTGHEPALTTSPPLHGADPVTGPLVSGCCDPERDSSLTSPNPVPQEHEPATKTSISPSVALLSQTLSPASDSEVSVKNEASSGETTSEGQAPVSQAAPEPSSQHPDLLQSQMRPNCKRPERPSSLDLSSSCKSSDDVSLTDGLSASGEKIKRRVKTPYTLKKWRPASWVVSTDTAFDLDLEFNSGGSGVSHIHLSSDPHGSASFGIHHINQSKSSMAVFLVGSGATATTTSEPDGMTSF
ncbi:bone morphogenetic protein receptor type-2-like [Antennarius striatus]|uniref:bone morphogenetic protein receptor type-2-like n=1 Tax=Antennarius striatus TaxID=241820 RepID=UPI0035AE858B